MSGGGSNVVSNFFKGTGELISGAGNFVDDIYQNISGNDAREQSKEEDRVKKKVKKARNKAKADMEFQDRLSSARDAANRKRKGSVSRQRRDRQTGRRSTILTDNLGSVGGETNQNKKSLLGY